MVYEPAEDSKLLKRNIPKYAEGVILDMGTGSGVLAEEAKKYGKVYAADIDKEAIEYCKRNIDKVEFVESDLFSAFKRKFDTIIFNPPYLPKDKGIEDRAIYGGKNGYEVIQRFFEEVRNYMKDDTKILLLFSSLTKKEKVQDFIEKKCLTYTEIDKEKLFFEELYVYLVEKSVLLKKLEQKGIRKIDYFSKGKRGVIYNGVLDNKEVIVKAKNPVSEAQGNIRHEAEMLKKLNKYGIGPRFLFSGTDYLVYEFVEGVMFPQYIQENSKQKIRKVLEEVFSQLQKLDELGINKEEMHRPRKHIIVGEKTVMIDFERAKIKKPQNITQFVKYLTSQKIYPILQEKGFSFDKDKLIQMASEYRHGRVSGEKIKKYVKQ